MLFPTKNHSDLQISYFPNYDLCSTLLLLHVISNHQSARPQNQADCGRVGPPFNRWFAVETL